MAVKRQKEEDDVSLFPFMDIITTVVGILTLMIATVAMEQMDSQDVALIEAYENTTKAIEEEQKRQKELQKLIDERIGPAAALTRLQTEATDREIQALIKQMEAAQAELDKLKEVKITVPMLDPSKRETVSSMQAQAKELAEQIAQLEKDISGRKDAPPANVSILPSGSGLNFTPHFIECQDGAVVLHDLNPPKTIRAADIAKDKDFLGVLEKAANNISNTVVFLIRSDGLSTYNAARKFCTDREIPNGRLPVVGAGKIDLSYFTQKAGAADKK
ncbi:MAG TPA: hypothetical protein VNQ76_17395 [Planctomicrobium sp.]|nr:hypothetical protein [Planctomicrobium sp.]